jgi:hypothetical protein
MTSLERASSLSSFRTKPPATSRMSNLAMPVTMLVTAISLATVGCAGAKVQSASCAADPRDSIYAATGLVYRDCAVDTKAKRISRDIHVDFQPPQPTGCYSAELEFVVGSDGRPELSTVRTLDTNNQALAQAVRASLSEWRYEPALRDGAPVRQIVVDRYAAVTSVVTMPARSTPRTPPRAPSC